MIHKIKPKIFSILYTIESFSNEKINFQNEILSIEELVSKFCFYKIKNKSKLQENDKIGLKKFLLEINKMNESYISFKQKNNKMKDKNKKFMSYYMNEIKMDIHKNEIEVCENLNESSESELNSIKSLKRNYDQFIPYDGIESDDSNATIDGLKEPHRSEYLKENFQSNVIPHVTISKKNNSKMNLQTI